MHLIKQPGSGTSHVNIRVANNDPAVLRASLRWLPRHIGSSLRTASCVGLDLNLGRLRNRLRLRNGFNIATILNSVYIMDNLSMLAYRLLNLGKYIVKLLALFRTPRLFAFLQSSFKPPRFEAGVFNARTQVHFSFLDGSIASELLEHLCVLTLQLFDLCPDAIILLLNALAELLCQCRVEMARVGVLRSVVDGIATLGFEDARCKRGKFTSPSKTDIRDLRGVPPTR